LLAWRKHITIVCYRRVLRKRVPSGPVALMCDVMCGNLGAQGRVERQRKVASMMTGRALSVEGEVRTRST